MSPDYEKAGHEFNEAITEVSEAIASCGEIASVEKALRALANMIHAGAYNPVRLARLTIAQAFKDDPNFRWVYVVNIAEEIERFERTRHAEPDTQVGPLSVQQRQELADSILKLIFG